MENYQLFLKLSDQLKSLSTGNLPVDNVPTLKVSADFQTTYEASVSGVQSGFKHLSKENIAYPPHCWLDAALARQIAIHIMIEKFDIPRRQIARELERNRATILNAMRTVDERMLNPEFADSYETMSEAAVQSLFDLVESKK
ncbi:MAG: hypothetical protein QM488_18370 [Rhizobiaceae bacterium]